MEEFLESVKSETKDLFRSKKNLANLLVLGILILALPLTVNSLRYQQIIRSQAAAEPITFTGPNVEQRNNKWFALRPQISLEISSPLGPPGSPGTPSPSPSGSPGPSTIPTPQPRACTVSWSLTPASPPANSTMTIVVTGDNDPQGWQNIGLWRNGQEICRTAAECDFSITGSPPNFNFSRVNAGAAGDYTLTFKTNNGSRPCGLDQAYTAQ